MRLFGAIIPPNVVSACLITDDIYSRHGGPLLTVQ